MSDLIARLRAAIDESEQIAQAAIGFDYGVKDWADDGDPVNRHIARHDPAAVLRRCAADRKLLAEHTRVSHRMSWDEEWQICATCRYDSGLNVLAYPCPTVKALAEGYGIEEVEA